MPPILSLEVPVKLPACLCVALAAVVIVSPPARAEWSLMTADLATPHAVTINTWTAADGLSVTAPSGKLTTLPTREVVLLSSDKKINAPTGWKLRLRNGDVVYGEPVAMSGQSITLKTPDLGAVNLALRGVAELTPAGARPSHGPAAGAEHDLVKLKTGDTIEGILASLSPGKLQIAVGADNARTDIELARVESISFGGVAAPRGVPPLSARFTFISGTILTLPLDKPENFSWSIPNITLADPAGGEPHKTIADKLVSVEVLGGRVVFLSDMDPARDEQSTYLGAKYPTQANSNVVGGPLRVAGVSYSRGLGVHTKSTLTYDLDGSFESLTFRPAIDDAAAPQGEANLSVSLDGKVVWHLEDLKSVPLHGAPPDVVTLPIKGAHKLELHAESPGKMDVLGRVDWLNIALTRP
jgi:hypothetical protein